MGNIDKDKRIEVLSNGFLISDYYDWSNKEPRSIANDEEEILRVITEDVKKCISENKSDVKNFRLRITLENPTD